MRAGLLRHRLIIEAPISVVDDIGGARQDWEPLMTVWGQIEPGRSKEFLVAQQIEPRLTHEITLRFTGELTAKHRLREKGTARVFNLQPPRDTMERNRELKIMAIEVL